jgi:ribosomal protein S18 acetylase RimI-like enzyme
MNKPSTPLSAVTLRPVVPTDEPLVLQIYASTRAEEMALVPWTSEQQKAFVRMQFDAQQLHYRNLYPDATHDLIIWNDRPVGRLYVARLPERIEILDITLLPQERNIGLGGYLIRMLMDEAEEASKRLRIYVENFNPSFRLFQRLGFASIDQDGIYILLEWEPTTRAG